MRWHLPALTLASLLTLGCGLLSSWPVAFASPNAVVTLDRSLAAPASALPPLVNRPRGIELHSCNDLIAAIGADKDLAEISELPQFNAYVDCLAVALVAEGRGVRDASIDISHAGERIYRDLDLASVASSLAPRRPAQHYRLQDLKFDSVQIAPLWVILRGNGYLYTFQALALGDFRGLRKSELLVRFIDRATNGGTYDKHSVLVLDASPSSSALRATDAIDVLKATKKRH
jgi:hypothetical protein